MPEISDADYELLKLTQTALGSSKSRLKALRVLKEASPETVLPELDSEDRLAAALSPLQEENKKLRADLDKSVTERLLKEKRDYVRGKGLKVEDVEKAMMEKGITSHESAVEFIEANSRVAVPATSTSRSWDKSAKVPTNDGLKADSNAWAREEAAKVMDELHGIKR